MRTRTLLVAPLAALVLIAPLSACSAAPEEQVCAVLESDGDDYVQVPDPSVCPPQGTAAPAQGPLWVPVSQLDTDDGDSVKRTTVKAKPTTSKPAPTTKRKTTTSRSR